MADLEPIIFNFPNGKLVKLSCRQHTTVTEIENRLRYTYEISSSGHFETKRSFLLGRLAAEKALLENCIEPQEIKKGSANEPIWPLGVIGSISHKKNIAIASISVDATLLGIGVDLELISSRPLKILSKIANADEQVLVQKSCNSDFMATILFAAKESVYKALHPIVKRAISFQEATITSVSPEHDGSSFLKVGITLSDRLSHECNCKNLSCFAMEHDGHAMVLLKVF